MYQFIFDDKTKDKINEISSNSKSIFKQFEDVDKRYSNLTDIQGDLNLTKMEYTKPTEEEVNESAKNSLQEFKNSSINNINDNFDKKNSDLSESIKSVKQANESDVEYIKQNYENAKQNAKDDAVARGLARSSIIVNTLDGLNQSMLSSLTQKAQELSESLVDFESQKKSLETEKQNALASFDIEYAVKLQDKINEINSDIQQKEKEVLEYNNKIAEKEANWNKDKNETAYNRTMDMAKLMADNGITVLEVLKQNEKYEMAKSHFASMTKQDALNELLNNSDYIKHLGSAFYNKLLTELKK